LEIEGMSVAELTTKTKASPFVGMGQIMTARDGGSLTSVLGSCIAVCVYHPRLHVGAMAHVVLPDSQGHAAGSAGKFADTAAPEILQQLAKLSDARAGYVAKLAGGASMFGASGPLQIGAANAIAVKEALAKVNIRVLGEHLGGTQGRRVEFNPSDGSLSIEIQGQPIVVL
jgi:chemotaxis protein CheD